jgi:hypothetical protein
MAPLAAPVPKAPSHRGDAADNDVVELRRRNDEVQPSPSGWRGPTGGHPRPKAGPAHRAHAADVTRMRRGAHPTGGIVAQVCPTT